MLERINKLLDKIKETKPTENSIVLQGPDTIKNIVEYETQKLAFLEQVNGALLAQITDPKMINKLSYKEKQRLLKFLCEIQNDSRDFILNVASLCQKNQFLSQILNMTSYETVTVTSDNGETFQSVITEDRRKELTEMLRDAINDRVRQQSRS